MRFPFLQLFLMSVLGERPFICRLGCVAAGSDWALAGSLPALTGDDSTRGRGQRGTVSEKFTPPAESIGAGSIAAVIIGLPGGAELMCRRGAVLVRPMNPYSLLSHN